MPLTITFAGDDTDELHAAIMAYMVATDQVSAPDDTDSKTIKGSKTKGSKSAAADDDDLDLDSGDGGDSDDLDLGDDAPEVDEAEKAERDKLAKAALKLSKKEGGPDKLRAMLKKLKAAKVVDVKAEHLPALRKALAAALKD